MTASPGERAAVFALSVANLAPWNEIADLVTDVGSALAIVDRRVTGVDRADPELVDRLAAEVTREHVERAEQELDELLRTEPMVTFHTVLDDTYPTNLREVYDRPPFVFVRGSLAAADEDAIAVVGTRRPSPEGREQARWLAAELAHRGVTVVSGLAAGIDTEAHTAALEAGGRTVAVMGTGIKRVYPAENVALAERIAMTGALVSQFTPTAPPRRENFPIRNRVTSGIAVGTAVIEASSTSGAKMQARLALEHGKRLFLVERLVMHEKWAQDYAERPGATVVTDVEQIIKIIECRPARVEQLKLV
jgi:DNA processing protein